MKRAPLLVIYKIILVCLSVCLSITEGQQKRFDLETQDAVSLATYRLLEARARQFLCMSTIALATDMNTSVLDGVYKN